MKNCKDKQTAASGKNILSIVIFRACVDEPRWRGNLYLVVLIFDY
jgi:hypothetical protein